MERPPSQTKRLVQSTTTITTKVNSSYYGRIFWGYSIWTVLGIVLRRRRRHESPHRRRLKSARSSDDALETNGDSYSLLHCNPLRVYSYECGRFFFLFLLLLLLRTFQSRRFLAKFTLCEIPFIDEHSWRRYFRNERMNEK